MDTATTTLIISQTITFVLLIISEILPMTDSQYNGILQIVLGILRQTVQNVKVEEKPKIVTVEKEQQTS